MTEPRIDPATLMALVDGRLEPAERRALEERVRADPALAAEVRALEAQRAALRARFDPVLDEPVPARMLPPPARARPAARLAAAAALVLAGAAAGSVATRAWLAGRADGADPGAFARQAVVAHAAYAPDARRPVEIASAEEQQLVAWLSKRLGRALRVPSLEAEGLSLMGGRLVPGDVDRPAAQLMYVSAGGERVTLFVRALGPVEGPTAFRVAEAGGVVTLYWVDRDWGYALTGALPRDALLRAATAVHAQLAPAP